MRRLFVTLIVPLVMGCGSDATQVILSVSSNLAIPSEANRATIIVNRADASQAARVTTQVLANQAALPGTLAIFPQGESLGPVDIEVSLDLNGGVVVRQHRQFMFERGKSLELPIFLAKSCVGVSCDTNETCTVDGCASREVNMLSAWNGAPSIETADAGGADTQSDAGVSDVALADTGASDVPTSDAKVPAPSCAAEYEGEFCGLLGECELVCRSGRCSDPCLPEMCNRDSGLCEARSEPMTPNPSS